MTSGGNFNLFLFARGADDRAIYLNVRNEQGQWSGWDGSSFSGLSTLYTPSATNLKDTIYLFAIDHRKVYVNSAKARDIHHWSGWEEVPEVFVSGNPPGVGGPSSIAAVGTRFGHLFLFSTRGPDGLLYVNKLTVSAQPAPDPSRGTWSGWSPVPGDFPVWGDPSVSEFVEALYLFARKAGDDNYYVNTANARDGTGWSGSGR